MVKLAGPLLSLEAQGSIGKVLTYKKGKTGAVARSYNRPHKRITGAQWTQRHIIGMITARWQVLPPGEKAPYIANAKLESTPMTGFNYFVRVAQADLKTHLGLILYYSMNEPHAEIVADSSGQGNNGQLKPSYPSNAPTKTDSLSIKYGNALLFNGSTDYILLPHLTISAPYTYTFWLFPNTLVGNAGLFGHGAVNNLYWWIPLTGELGFRLQNLSHEFFNIQATVKKWQHICMTYAEDNTISIYKNGSLVDSRVIVGMAHTLSTIAFARNLWTNGKMDEVKVFNRVLGSVEIKKQYDLLRLNKKRQPTLIR